MTKGERGEGMGGVESGKEEISALRSTERRRDLVREKRGIFYYNESKAVEARRRIHVLRGVISTCVMRLRCFLQKVKILNFLRLQSIPASLSMILRTRSHSFSAAVYTYILTGFMSIIDASIPYFPVLLAPVCERYSRYRVISPCARFTDFVSI